MSVVFAGLAPLVVEDVIDEGDVIVVRARTPAAAVPCPDCGAVTARVHVFHQRVVGDVLVDARRVLVVLGANDEINWVSLCNVPEVHLLEAGQLNTYDVLVSDEVVFTAEALEEFLGVPAEEGSK